MKIYQQRETYTAGKVISHLRKGATNSFALSIFGYSHDFSDEYTKHNQQHPNEQVTVLNIYPKSYDAYYTREGQPRRK